MILDFLLQIKKLVHSDEHTITITATSPKDTYERQDSKSIKVYIRTHPEYHGYPPEYPPKPGEYPKYPPEYPPKPGEYPKHEEYPNAGNLDELEKDIQKLLDELKKSPEFPDIEEFK